MKILVPFLSLAIARSLRAADSKSTTTKDHATLAPTPSLMAGVLLSVGRSPDKHSLLIRYGQNGQTNEQKITMAYKIADFRYCSWLESLGFALAISDSEGNIYWSVNFYSRLGQPINMRRINAPPGYKLTGIAQAGPGDTLSVTAMDFTPNDPKRTARGWIYLRGCPPSGELAPPPFTGAEGQDPLRLRLFEIPAAETKPSK